ncbi:uncharacterized protein PV06_11684 [Exophiala oligosperma]|uniref:Phytanoyl-CoA dioxygenase n=1 Tax=Exophiala oligosperma TaxID=215243 RepID=A0A0D2DK05_9EURO|nr:uncharacterized protein PV06_11684 [Exophiala oligosperma]KIW36009.1 hypothetical protein PV06_11684 [Exophiala oligosperma]
MSTEDLAAIEKDTRIHLLADKPWDGTFFPIQTRRVNGLASKSKIFMEKLVCYQAYQDACDTLLTSRVSNWVGDVQEHSTSKPQLNNTIVFSIGPGAKAQPLHRDDMIHHRVKERMESSHYTIGQDSAIGFLVGGKKTTKANGATRFIPGSHLWKHDTPPAEDLCVYAELEPGDGFIMLASCYHGGSANTTTDQERLVYSCFMTKGYLRQEENQYLNNPPEIQSSFYNDEMLKLIGYNLSAPFLGWIKEGHPLAALGRAQPLGDMY